MTVHPVTLDPPNTLYTRMKQPAAQTQRSVEDELLDAYEPPPKPDGSRGVPTYASDFHRCLAV